MRKIIAIFLIFTSCINPYEFNQTDSHGYLVVEGYISNKAGDNGIILSRSGMIQGPNVNWVDNAELVVIENDTEEYRYAYQSDGLYKPVQEDFIAKDGNSYHLKIVLDGQVYESEKVSMQNPLEIDGLSFSSIIVNQSGNKVENPRLELQLTTVNDENASRYYIYTFEETWLAVAGHSQNKIIKPIYFYNENNEPIHVEFETREFENLTNCWPDNSVVGISIATTEGLSRNQLINVPVFNVSLNSDRLLYRYSVLVNQYAVSRDVHHYFKMLREFSENSGFLYDIQPGFIEGNIHNKSDEEDNVIGIFYAASHTSSRIFNSFNDLSYEAQSIVRKHQPSCESYIVEYPIVPLDSIDVYPDSIVNIVTEQLTYMDSLLMYGKGLVIGSYYEDYDFSIVSVQLSNVHCVNCRAYGTNVKPEWWY